MDRILLIKIRDKINIIYICIYLLLFDIYCYLIFILIAPTIANNKINNDIISHMNKFVYIMLPMAIISVLSINEPSQVL